MLKLFRKDVVAQAAIIVAVGLAMWIGEFIHPSPIPIEGGGPLFYWITGPMSPRVGAVVAYVLILLEGFLFNSILYRYKMIGQNTLMPMLFYVLSMSLGAPTLSPIVIGSLLLIMALGQLMVSSTLLSLPPDKVFGAAALVSLATLFCPPMAVFFVVLVIDMFTYSLYGWRDWAMLLLGLLAPLILVETVYFVTDELFYRNYVLLYELTDLHLRVSGGWVEWVYSALFVVVLVMGVGAMLMNGQNRNVNFKKNSTAIMVFLVGSLLFTLYSHLIPISAQAFAIPFACACTALFIEPQRREGWREVAFVLMVAAAIALNLFI